MLAQPLTDSQIIKNNIPAIFFTLKDNSTAEYLKTGNILNESVNETFNSKDGSRYLVVLYSTGTDVSQDDQMADLRVIKIEKKGNITISPKINYNLGDYPLEIGSKISVKDLNGDGIDEVFVTNTNWKDGAREDFLFRWNGSSLIDITPIIQDDSIHFKSSGLLNISVSDFTVGGKRILYSTTPKFVDKAFNGTLVQAYRYDNSLISEGAFDYLMTIQKLDKKPIEKSESVELKSEGDYVLSIKNISDHKDAVRAEVSINTNIVVKPSEFCMSLPSKDDKKVKSDDDGDADEDHLKGCKSKPDVSVNLSLLKVNMIKVKMYGKKNSRLQLTLKRR